MSVFAFMHFLNLLSLPSSSSSLTTHLPFPLSAIPLVHIPSSRSRCTTRIVITGGAKTNDSRYRDIQTDIAFPPPSVPPASHLVQHRLPPYLLYMRAAAPFVAARRAGGERGGVHPRSSAARSSASVTTPRAIRLSAMERIQRW